MSAVKKIGKTLGAVYPRISGISIELMRCYLFHVFELIPLLWTILKAFSVLVRPHVSIVLRRARYLV